MASRTFALASNRGVILYPLLPWIIHKPIDLATPPGPSPGPARTAGETINRTNQAARLKTTPAVSRPIMGPDKERNPTGSLRTVLTTNQAINGIDSRENT